MNVANHLNCVKFELERMNSATRLLISALDSLDFVISSIVRKSFFQSLINDKAYKKAASANEPIHARNRSKRKRIVVSQTKMMKYPTGFFQSNGYLSLQISICMFRY